MLVEVRKVLEASMSTIQAHPILDSIVNAPAAAPLGATEVVSHRVKAEKSYLRVQLSYAILERRSAERPSVDSDQRKGCS
jgi:hypothetical protein